MQFLILGCTVRQMVCTFSDTLPPSNSWAEAASAMCETFDAACADTVCIRSQMSNHKHGQSSYQHHVNQP